MVVGQAGLLALAPGVRSAEVAGWLGEARAFAAEWAELRAVQQNQLSGTPLRCPLQVGARGETPACHVPIQFNGFHGVVMRALLLSSALSDAAGRHCPQAYVDLCFYVLCCSTVDILTEKSPLSVNSSTAFRLTLWQCSYQVYPGIVAR